MKRLPFVAAGLIVLIALGVFSSIVTQGFQELGEVTDEHRWHLKERARLEGRVEALKGTLDAVRSDPAAVESLVRKDLGWVRPGERVILLATPLPSAQPFVDGPEQKPVLTLKE